MILPKSQPLAAQKMEETEFNIDFWHLQVRVENNEDALFRRDYDPALVPRQWPHEKPSEPVHIHRDDT
jgi:hypothetical protein